MARPARVRHGVSALLAGIWLGVSSCSQIREAVECGSATCPRLDVEWASATNPDLAAADRLSSLARRASHTPILDTLGLGPEPITLYLVNGLVGSDAMAFGEERRVVIPVGWAAKSERELSELVSHELTHIAIARINGYRRIPAWLREGVAEIASGRIGCQASQDLSSLQALGFDLRGALHDTTGFPTALHYKVYGSFSAFVVGASRSGLSSLLHRIALEGAASGFKSATGMGQDQLEGQWRDKLRNRNSNEHCGSSLNPQE
jgi:hypothetical protein